MKAPVSRRRGRWPALQPITMDLLGMAQDGQLYLWSAAGKVQPMDRFPVTPDKRIVEGHYVIEHKGKAVTAYIGNGTNPGVVTVQFMCRNAVPVALPQLLIEGDVLGRVIPDPAEVAKTREMLRRLTEEVHERQTAPHRKRGQA